MALSNSDIFLVNRSGSSYKETYQNIKNDIVNSVVFPPDDDPYLPLVGGNLTGGVTQTERAISSGSFNLATGNFWSAGAINIPNPSNKVVGQSGLIRLTAAPSAWGSQFRGPVITATYSTPAIVPFYVESTSVIRLGNPVEVA